MHDICLAKRFSKNRRASNLCQQPQPRKVESIKNVSPSCYSKGVRPYLAHTCLGHLFICPHICRACLRSLCACTLREYTPRELFGPLSCREVAGEFLQWISVDPLILGLATGSIVLCGVRKKDECILLKRFTKTGGVDVAIAAATHKQLFIPRVDPLGRSVSRVVLSRDFGVCAVGRALVKVIRPVLRPT